MMFHLCLRRGGREVSSWTADPGLIIIIIIIVIIIIISCEEIDITCLVSVSYEDCFYSFKYRRKPILYCLELNLYQLPFVY